MKAKSETVKVAVRVRPMNKKEKQEKSEICVSVDNQSNQVTVSSDKKEAKTFQFDYVYPMETTQREVYDQVAFPIVESIFQGYNGTIFAYGQTGCGKTYTMMGELSNPTLRGIIPNAFDHIFGYINSEGSSKKFLLRCSFVEIYNEEVRDLLVKDNQKPLEVREDPKKGTFVKGLSYTHISNPSEIIKCLDKGNANRHVGATSMNDKSSRSHSIFTVYIEIEEGCDKDSKIRSGKLNLVDLAGSERVSKTNATGQTFDEGKKINLSLTALGSVIDALASNRKHIPYKDSKLTRLLADSLGGNTKTVMFANVSPASYNYDETLGTLRYASRAKLIKNAPKINEDPKDALLRQYEEQIRLLKEQLSNGGAGGENVKIIEKIVEVKVRDNDGNNNNLLPDFNNSHGNMNDEERQKLLERIAQLEKGMISGGPSANLFDEVDDKESKDSETQKKLEEERKKHEEEFKEYRKQQLKNIEDMEIKYEKLREEKRIEEENLLNDVTKLRKKVKSLQTEIEDLKFESQKDRTDFFENIKGLNKDNSLYLGIIRFLLSDVELKKILERSKYNEDNEKWYIHPFTFRNKELAFPNIKPSDVPVLIDNEINNREVIFQNYDDDDNEYNSNNFSSMNNINNMNNVNNVNNANNDEEDKNYNFIDPREKKALGLLKFNSDANTKKLLGMNKRTLHDEDSKLQIKEKIVINSKNLPQNLHPSSSSKMFINAASMQNNKLIESNSAGNIIKNVIKPSKLNKIANYDQGSSSNFNEDNNSFNANVSGTSDVASDSQNKLSRMILKNKEKERYEQLSKQAQIGSMNNIGSHLNNKLNSSKDMDINAKKSGKLFLNPIKGNTPNSNFVPNKMGTNIPSVTQVDKSGYLVKGKKIKLLGPIAEKVNKQNEEMENDEWNA